MTEQENDRFDRLLKAMAQGEPHKADKHNEVGQPVGKPTPKQVEK